MTLTNTGVTAQIVQHLSPGGIETMVLDLMRHSRQETKIFSLEGTREQALNKWPILKNVQDKLIFLNKQPGFQRHIITKLKALFIKHGITRVHTHHIGPLLYGGLASRLSGISTLLHTEHDAWHLSKFKRRCLQKCLIKFLKPIWVADASAVALKVSSYFNNSKIKVIPNGIDIDKFTPGDINKARAFFNLPENVLLIGCAGRFEHVKGHDILISAMTRLPTGYHLAIAGDGSCRQSLEQQVKQAGLTARVHFLGVVDKMPTFYQSLDVFCLPSRAEGMPLSPLEAQACNIPSIVTNVGGCAETLCKQSSILVPPEKPCLIADAILTLTSFSFKKSPRAFVQQHGNIKHTVAAYAQLANNVK